MNVQEAINAARSYVGEVFAGEGIKNVALEEVTFEPGAKRWRVTIGFLRPWDEGDGASDIRATIGLPPPLKRTYKVVSIDNESGQVLSLTNREPATA